MSTTVGEPEAGQSTSVAVIVCTRDRPRDVLRLVQSLQGQDHPITELVVVDSSEVSDTSKIVTELALPGGAVKTYVPSSRGLSLQRNAGLASLQSEPAIVCFLDDDVELDKGYIRTVVSTFVADVGGRIVGVCGNATDETKRRFLSRLARRLFFITDNSTGRLLRSGDAGHVFAPERDQKVAVLSGCNMCFRAALFRNRGLRFDEALTEYAYMEDQDLSLRAGVYGELTQLADAKLAHHRSVVGRPSQKRLFEMYIMNSFYLLRKNLHPSPLDYLCYGWRLVGKLVQAFSLTVLTLSVEPIAGWLIGVVHLRSLERAVRKNG